ncbi:reticulocalbin-2 isoform X2 [Oncorhynchus keta]|uniref:reticulocalbin-2 isoform X2 n=1 Tax=Oncorhynchus keta TaxID=8018 RepID=UPI0015FA4A84|nr:reticulocalbin-2 isoform X2 [Oncorhynchus keta]
MKYSVIPIALLVMHCAFGERSHNHEDHYVGHQHSPEHDMDLLLGTEEEDGIKKLSPAEQRNKIMEILKKIDKDSDKHLTSEEITLWIQHVYKKYALDDAEERFPEFDTNNDGVVSWEEYNMVVHERLHLKEKKRFDFADMGGTPGLNLTEFLAFTHPSEVDYMADFAVEDVLSEYDTDKDGFISLREFIGDVRTNEEDDPSQWEMEETVRFDDLYDQDKDGKLNREEQLRWVAPNSYGSAREEAVHLIKEMDQDGDGKLSEAEVLKNQDIFMNSEVTDYGRQLHVSHDEL